MAQVVTNPQFEEILEAVESLSVEDQAVLIEVIRRRIAETERARLVTEIAEGRAAHRAGEATRGSVADFLTEVGE